MLIRILFPQNHFATSRVTAETFRINLKKIPKNLILKLVALKTTVSFFFTFSVRHRISQVRDYNETKNAFAANRLHDEANRPLQACVLVVNKLAFVKHVLLCP